MAQVINTNVAALFAGSALNRSANALQTAQARLSSGLRINSAKDDATGLALAMGIDSKVKGTNMAIRTANDGISSAQTADGLLGQVTDNLQRIREISVQTNGVGSVEATALVAENTRIFALPEMTVPTAVVNNSAGTTYTMTGAANVTLAATAAAAGTGIGAAGAGATLVQTAITAVAVARASLGADMSSLSSAVANLQTSSVNLSAAYSRIMDTDYAAETAAMTRNNILQQAGTAVLAQANQTPQTVMTLLR